MPSLAEISSALTGSLLIARRDPSALGYFNMTVDGFWRSFAAILLVAPIYLAISGLNPGAIEGEPIREEDGISAVTRLIVLGVEWVAYPIAMVLVARLLGLQQHYAGYIIVYNWSSVPAMAVLLPPFLLFNFGFIGAKSLFSLFIALSLAVAYYRWLIARMALQVTPAIAVGIVIFDFAVSMLAGTIMQRLLAGPPSGV